MVLKGIEGMDLGAAQEKKGKPEDVKKAAREFEALFINNLFKVMRESVPKGGLLDGGRGEEIYTSMLDEALSAELAKRGGIGLANIVLKQWEPKKVKE